jgi:hypothetical protein
VDVDHIEGADVVRKPPTRRSTKAKLRGRCGGARRAREAFHHSSLRMEARYHWARSQIISYAGCEDDGGVDAGTPLGDDVRDAR